MELSLIKLKTEGLRCPDIEVRFTEKSNQSWHITLIKMPNGTGKTTTLNLLRAALSGSAEEWTDEQIEEFKAKDVPKSKGSFLIELLVDNKKLTIEMVFDFVNNKLKYFTTIGSGRNPGFNPPQNMKRILRKEFINLYVFDAELVDDLCDFDKTRADDLIRAIYQLYLLDTIKNNLEEYWLDMTKNNIAKTGQGLSMKESKLIKIEKRIDEIKNKLKECESENDKLTKRYKELNSKFKNEILKNDKNKDQYRKLEKEYDDAKNKVEEQNKLLLMDLRKPQNLSNIFLSNIKEIKSKLDKLKLPRSSSKEFFIELSKAEKCICGNAMNNNMRKSIISESEQYMGEDDTSVLNHIKHDIREQIIDSEVDSVKEFKLKIDTLGKYVHDRDVKKVNLDAAEDFRVKSGGKELEEKQKQLEELSNKIKLNEVVIEQIKRKPYSDDDENSMCLEALKDISETLKDQVAKATGTVNLREKINSICAILDNTKDIAQERIKAMLVDETNKILRELLPRELIKLEKITNSLVLEGQKKGSVGQTLALGYGFLSTLFGKTANNSLPFIVDSPVVSLDLDVRRKIAKIVPQLSKQYIAFVISSEQDGFIDVLDKESSDSINYLTLFRKTSKTKDLINKLPKKGIYETENGILSDSKEFFDSFQVEEE